MGGGGVWKDFNIKMTWGLIVPIRFLVPGLLECL